MPLPPIVSSCVLSLAIGCASNVIAQKLKAYSNDAPFVFDGPLFVHFAILAVITTPVNYCWQNWLERTFPGWKMVKQKRAASASSLDDEEKQEKQAFLNDDGEDKKAIEDEVRVRDWWNIFRKWFTDCITLGALLNTFMFLALMGLMEGKKTAQIADDVKNEMWTIIWDSYKVWPVANFFSTTYCPVERRIVFLSFCGLLWNIYLTLVAARL